ncbi:MAG TPA: MFS transporter [Acinetobacter lwoffii]|mgnify:CR=1 FL=1|uniref:MFS transporter n=1 Tax=Acinetobacter lwoffii TaxID=28090 RepID=A0A9D2ZZ12_ACILW|nr:MFS transporter [Acinetobacter sp. 10FS3-1]MDM1781975.1 MFS transporter [Acinetobacter indicus]QKQ69462.1 MFS transporter [Acinetobacter sp. 10FS3-1]HJF27889.1 MFS transporter [Acinetobacter lwoffii]
MLNPTLRARLQSPSPYLWQKIATALCFFSLGFSTAAWAPLIPYAQQRLFLNHADFGLLLLCAGIGSMLAMPLAGRLANKFGCRPVLAVILAAFLFILPALAVSPSTLIMAISLFFFGASAGALGVTVNLQAAQIEKYVGKSLMSGFHGVCSLGGLAGVLGMTTLMGFGLLPLMGAVTISIILLLITVVAIPFCLGRPAPAMKEDITETAHEVTKKSRPTWAILGIGLICFVAFLSEGAAMDWSGIYLATEFSLPAAQTGLAYSFFAALMVLGRFSGHLFIQFLGEKTTILLSALLAATGLFIVVFAPVWPMVLVGYAVLGLGSANIVPLMFSRAGRQKTLASHVALSYVSVFAYTGSLIGPALVGFGSEIVGLSVVFTVVAFGLLSIVILNHLTADQQLVEQPEAALPVLENETPA